MNETNSDGGLKDCSIDRGDTFKKEPVEEETDDVNNCSTECYDSKAVKIKHEPQESLTLNGDVKLEPTENGFTEKNDTKTDILCENIRQKSIEMDNGDVRIGLTVIPHNTQVANVKQECIDVEHTVSEEDNKNESDLKARSEDVNSSEEDVGGVSESRERQDQQVPGSSSQKSNEQVKSSKKRYNGEKPYECSICMKKFFQSSHLISHMRIHSDERPFECNICQKKFRQLSDYNKHKRIHSGEKPFECAICTKKFTHLSSLHKHKVTHGNEQPYECNICTKKFNQLSNLNRHVKRIHTDCKLLMDDEYIFMQPAYQTSKADTELYECDVCSKNFNHFSKFSRHMKMHSGEKPFMCSICNKTFTHAFNLNTHVRVHSGEKPFECSICEKKFNQSSTLRRHERIHSGIKPYKCDICTKTFNQSASLRTHKLMHERRYSKQAFPHSQKAGHVKPQEKVVQASEFLETGFNWFK